MNCPNEVAELIQQIKDKANALEFNEDGVAFDQAVGEIDYLCWKLRQVTWAPVPRGFVLSKPSDIITVHEALRDLFGE